MIREFYFLKIYNIIEQKESEELDIPKFNDERMDFIEAKGYTTKVAFDFPINNIYSVKVVSLYLF